MAYDDASTRRQDADVADPSSPHPRFTGEPGFRDEPDFRAPPTFATSGYQPGHGVETKTTSVPPEVLDDVFDDPADGAPGRDRLGVHWVWELLLLLGVVSLGAMLWLADPLALRGENLPPVLVAAAVFALLGAAVGVTLRAAAPNLAIGPVAVAAGVHFAQQGADGVAGVAVTAVLAAGALGVVLAALVVLLHVPGWAASLAAAAGVVVWLQQQPAQSPLTGGYDPTGHAVLVFFFVAALVILGGLLGTVKPIRRALGRFRPVSDPADRRGVLAALLTSGALVLSMCLAAGAGILLAAADGVPVAGAGGTRWLELTVIALAVALVGGTSAYGRRGGVFGTVLAALALVLFDTYQQAQGWAIALLATTAVMLAVGLVVTRLVERLGRPRSADADDDWAPTPAVSRSDPDGDSRSTDAWAGGPDSWTSALPAQPARPQPSPWDDRWGR
jgi:ribose/xylose/arabinose/galactoside ABC-type transport system permease subunit